MDAARTTVSGAIIAGAGVAVHYIGQAIFSVTGTAEGAIVHYGSLVSAVSVLLIAVGGLVGVIGILAGIAHMLGSDEEGLQERAEPERRPRRQDGAAPDRPQRREPRERERR